MSEVKEKSVLILKHEEKFATILANHVIDKPQLSLWMILIPIFLFFTFMSLTSAGMAAKYLPSTTLSRKSVLCMRQLKWLIEEKNLIPVCW